MAENIDGNDLLGSGGHVWMWGARQQTAKTLRTVGVAGAARMVTVRGERPVAIVARGGGPAVLKASGASRAAADTALDALDAAIQAYVDSGEAVAWADDKGRSGSYLVLTHFQPADDRTYNNEAGTWHAWERYTLTGVELGGRTG